MNVKIIQEETLADEFLSKVMEYVISGWPRKCPEMRRFYSKRRDLAVENGCLISWYKLVVPTLCREAFLQEIHATHFGIGKMKSLARSYFWWPKLDEELNEIRSNCEACMQNSTNPPAVAKSQWPLSEEPNERVHMDFGHAFDRTFLLLVDSFSKRIEI